MWPFSRPLARNAITAVCPNCGGCDLARLWTVVHSRYDGTREEAVPAGGRYLCERCGAQFDVVPNGVFRPFSTAQTPPPSTDTPPTTKKPDQKKIPIRLPR